MTVEEVEDVDLHDGRNVDLHDGTIGAQSDGEEGDNAIGDPNERDDQGELTHTCRIG